MNENNKPNITNDVILYDWTPESMLEITFKTPDNFLKVKETLTRIGIASKKDKKLFQSCCVLHKQGKYFIVHYKELFSLDGKFSSLSVDDVKRRNTISKLLHEWGLITILNPSKFTDQVTLSTIKIIPYKEKDEWELVEKYHIGKKY